MRQSDLRYLENLSKKDYELIDNTITIRIYDYHNGLGLDVLSQESCTVNLICGKSRRLGKCLLLFSCPRVSTRLRTPLIPSPLLPVVLAFPLLNSDDC